MPHLFESWEPEIKVIFCELIETLYVVIELKISLIYKN